MSIEHVREYTEKEASNKYKFIVNNTQTIEVQGLKKASDLYFNLQNNKKRLKSFKIYENDKLIITYN